MQFSRTASYYHLLERWFFGHSLQKTRVGQLKSLSPGSYDRVLIVGEGNGRFIEAFLADNPGHEVTVIDESEAMLARARSRLEAAGLDASRVIFRAADLQAVQLPRAHYGLIVTNFFFSNFCESDVAAMISQLSVAAGPQAQWLFGDFVLPTTGWRRWRARIWLRVLYRFFAWTAAVPARALPGVEPHLRLAGFICRAETFLCGGLLRSARYEKGGAVSKVLA